MTKAQLLEEKLAAVTRSRDGYARRCRDLADEIGELNFEMHRGFATLFDLLEGGDVEAAARSLDERLALLASKAADDLILDVEEEAAWDGVGVRAFED